MSNPTETHGRGDEAEISRKKPRDHREPCQQEASIPLTKVSTECQPNANDDTERVNRNHTLSSTVSSSLPESVGPQKSPRIGAVPPRPAAASAPSNSLLSTARRYVQRADVDWCKPFIKTRRRYLDRCSVPFEWDNRWHSAVLCQVAENGFMVQVRDQKTGEVCDQHRVRLNIEFIDALAHA